MQLPFVSQILGSSQCQSWRDDSLYCWVICQVQEEHHAFHRSILLEVCPEEPGNLHVNSHSCEDYTKVLLRMIGNVLSFDQ